MSRPLRIEYAGAFYHILNRGNAGIPIFTENKDRKKFLYYIDKMAWRFAVKIHTYCLMDTHYHFIYLRIMGITRLKSLPGTLGGYQAQV